jgi:hypothetical protein
MPSISATIKRANSDGKFETLETATIYNPLPFDYASGDIVSVRKSNKVWLIERCLNKTPFADFRASSQSVSDGKVIWGLQSSAGGIASAPGDGKAIRIDCPVSSLRFKIWANVQAQYLGGGTPSNPAQGEMRGGLLVNGVQVQPNPWYNLSINYPAPPTVTDPSGAPLHTHTISSTALASSPATMFGLSFETVISLSKDSIIGFYVIAPDGSDGAVQSGTFVIEPAF